MELLEVVTPPYIYHLLTQCFCWDNALNMIHKDKQIISDKFLTPFLVDPWMSEVITTTTT